MNTITQDMRYRQSLINFAVRHGVSKASRRYNKSRSYIYCWLKRYHGGIESLPTGRTGRIDTLTNTSRNIRLLTNMCRRNPKPGRVELWCRLRKRGYQRSMGGMYRVLHNLHLQPKPAKKVFKPKPCQQMTPASMSRST